MTATPGANAIRRRAWLLVPFLALAGALAGGPTVLDWLTKNTARIAVDHPDPTLRAIRIALEPGTALEATAERLAALPRWKVVAPARGAGRLGLVDHTLRATRTTRLWRFVDDVELEFTRVDGRDGPATLVTGRSQSRVGKGDFGQNARNLREALRAIRPIPSDPPSR